MEIYLHITTKDNVILKKIIWENDLSLKSISSDHLEVVLTLGKYTPKGYKVFSDNLDIGITNLALFSNKAAIDINNDTVIGYVNYISVIGE